MSVTLNEAALRNLLDTRESPVGGLVEERAQEVVAVAQDRLGKVMHRKPEIVSAIGYEMEGSTAIIGIRDEGSISRRMAQKAADEQGMDKPGNWLVGALNAIRSR